MAPKPTKLDTEWAESLVGLRLKVPDYWWVGWSGRNFNDGKIDSYDSSTQKFNLILDSDPSYPYPMAYDAVYEYADQEASTFDAFNLPPDAVLQPLEEEEIGVDAAKYKVTVGADWQKITPPNNPGRALEPIPWTGDNEEFGVNATNEQIDTFKDRKGEIQFEKVFQWSIPTFGEDEVNLFE